MGSAGGKIGALAGAASPSRSLFWPRQMHSRCTAAILPESFSKPPMLLEALIYKAWCRRQDSNLH